MHTENQSATVEDIKVKKFLALTLAFCMLLVCFISCDDIYIDGDVSDLVDDDDKNENKDSNKDDKNNKDNKNESGNESEDDNDKNSGIGGIIGDLIGGLIGSDKNDNDDNDNNNGTNGNNGNNGNNGSNGGGITDESTYLPNVDFEGYNFRVLHADGTGYFSAIDDEDADTTSILHQAEVERDSEISDRFNIMIKDVWSDSYQITDFVIKDALNVSSSYDIGYLNRIENACDILSMNLAQDVKSMPMLDLTKEWYVQQANEEFSVFGKQFFVSGAYPEKPSSPQFLFNKDFIREKNMDLPYDLILSGKWTIDRLMQYTTVGYSNFNEYDNTIDGLDKFGYAGHDRSICYFYQGIGGKTTARTIDGSVVPILGSGNADTLYETVTEFFNHKANWTNTSLNAGDPTSSHRVFYDGRAMFCYWITATLNSCDIESFEYGLGILPMYSTYQGRYYCPASSGITLFPLNLEDPYTTGYLYESLCEASQRIVYPAALREDVAFGMFTDEESVEVQKLVDRSLSYDILDYCDPSEGYLSSYGFIWDCAQNKVKPSILAMSYEDAYNLLFDEFFDGVRKNVNR